VNVYNGTCKSTDSINIEIINCDVFIPNVFTPNGDRFNEYFYADAAEDIYDFHLTVLNRWGEQVWETSEKEGKWDGKKNNKAAAEAVYYWIMTYICKYEINQVKRKGTVTLLR